MGLRVSGQAKALSAGLARAPIAARAAGGPPARGLRRWHRHRQGAQSRSAGQDVRPGRRLLNKGAYSDAARKFEDLDRDHPYAPEARRAIVMAAYAYYKGGKYQEAIASAQRYTTLHPGTKDAALAHHIVATAHFDDIKEPRRDQTATRKALAELKILRQRYPDSPYAKQAENRIRIAEDVLAASEMDVAPLLPEAQQLTRPPSTASRWSSPTTRPRRRSRRRCTASSRPTWRSASRPKRRRRRRCWAHNFPNSPWYKNAYALLKSGGLSPQANSGSWISNIVKAPDAWWWPAAEAGAGACQAGARPAVA